MVLAGVAFQPDLWAAGVDIVGIASLVTFLENTSDYRRATGSASTAISTDRDFLESAPITHLDDIRAPRCSSSTAPTTHGCRCPRLSRSRRLTKRVVLPAPGLPG